MNEVVFRENQTTQNQANTNSKQFFSFKHLDHSSTDASGFNVFLHQCELIKIWQDGLAGPLLVGANEFVAKFRKEDLLCKSKQHTPTNQTTHINKPNKVENNKETTRLPIKSYCKTTHIEAAITSHLFKRGMHCWSEPGFGLGFESWMKKGGRGWAKEFCTRKKEHVYISHDLRDHIGWVTLTWVRLTSHEIISHSHLSRNPLDSIVKSYCKTTHIEAAITSHLFKRGMHCWSEPPHVLHPVRHSTWAAHQHVVYNNQLTQGARHALWTDRRLY